MKKIKLVLIITTVVALQSCEKKEIQSEEMLVENIKETPVGVVFNEEVGEWQAKDDGYERFLWEEGIENQKSNKALGGQILSETDVILGPELYEVEHFFSQGGYILTGIGFRAASGSITTMRLERRYLYENGDLGVRYASNHGTVPNWGLEVWYAVPDGHAIVGFGARIINANVTTLHVYYMEIDSNARFVGAIKTAKVGSVPLFNLELSLTPGNGFAYDLFRTAITGVGVREYNDNLYGVKLRIGQLK